MRGDGRPVLPPGRQRRHRRKRSPGRCAGRPSIGRSRGGPTMKIHLAAGGRCRPPAFVLTGGQANDAPTFTEVMARLRMPRRRGRLRTRPDVVLADKAYSSRAIREHLRSRRIWAVIPIRADQNTHRLRRGSRVGRPPAPTVRCTSSATRSSGASTALPQAMARDRHPLREDRHHIHGRSPRRGPSSSGQPADAGETAWRYASRYLRSRGARMAGSRTRVSSKARWWGVSGHQGRGARG